MKKASYLILLVATAVFVLLIVFPGASGRSTNLCGQCHSSFTQYLDILEGASANQVPSAVSVGETKTVSIVVENSGNPGIYSTLSSASVTLSARNGHFSVNSPTYNIGDLPLGTKTATWQITGVSDGYDWLLITAQGENPHFSIPFQDNYSPSPLITVGSPTGTPPPTPTPTPTPTPGPTSAATPTPAPTLTPVPTPTPTPNPNSPSTPEPTNQLSIVLTSPVEGERWAAGTIHSIRWNTQGGTSPLTVTLEYSASSTSGPWIAIAAGISNNGSFTWKVPNTTRVYVRAVVTDSANPPQSVWATSGVEIAGTDPEFPLIIIPAILLPAIALLAVFFKRRNTKHVSGKLEKTVVNSHVESSIEIVLQVLRRFWMSVK